MTQASVGRPASWYRLAAVVALVVAAGGCATLRDPWEDTRIESEVKARLVAQRDANLTRLGVVSRRAIVYLSGRVGSADQKGLAETLAKGVSGVKRVVNTLEVRSVAEQAQPPPRP
jgi:osmotically-inducible protein OsmY